jgi:hypothetical protein
MQTGYVQQLARRSVWFGGIEHHAAFVAHDLRDSLRQLANGAVHPGTHVNVRQHRLGVLLPHLAIQLHHVNAGCGHVVHVQELTHRRTAAPHHHIRRVLGGGLVEATQQRRDHVGIARVEVIVRPVQVSRHHRAIVPVKLTVVGIRAVPIAEAMLAIVLMDHFLRQRAQNADVTTTIPRW